MKKDLKSILQKLERIEENQMGQLQGGFASVATPSSSNQLIAHTNKKISKVTNNCHGTNCSHGCGWE